MKNRRLTPEQIEKLFFFLEQRDVKYYDLQLELVDHFASAIEQKWETDPGLTFDDALRAEYKQFNRYDFSQILETKEDALKKKYLKIQWKYILEFFRLPKIIITIAITLVLFTAFMLSYDFIRLFVLCFVSFYTAFFTYRFILFPRKYQLKLIQGKTFLLYDHFKKVKARVLGSVYLINLLMISINQIGKHQILAYPHIVYIKLLLAFLLTLVSIITIVTATYVPKRIKEDFTREFPQFVKA